MKKDKVIVALDVDNYSDAEKIVKELKGVINIFKVGKQLFTKEGPRVIKMVHEHGCKVFLDLKYHDIPNTVSQAAKAAADLGVFMFNVHIEGGVRMMQECAAALKEIKNKPYVLGITVLTSIDQITMNQELNVLGSVEEEVVRRAELAKKAGLDGVVASPHEILAIRKACGQNFMIVTPGVRPEWSKKDDQERVDTPKDAILAGADYIVVGRPIIKAPNRLEAAKRLIKEL